MCVIFGTVGRKVDIDEGVLQLQHGITRRQIND